MHVGALFKTPDAATYRALGGKNNYRNAEAKTKAHHRVL
jgi:hypothetical protein